MKRRGFSLPALLALCTLALCTPAFACKPVFSRDPIGDFIHRRDPGAAIFLGDVVSVKQAPDRFGNMAEDIVFHPTRRWMGPSLGDIAARGQVTKVYLTDCGGLGDFSVNVGERWLIFGELREGVLYPVNTISMKIVDGRIPRTILRHLKNLHDSGK